MSESEPPKSKSSGAQLTGISIVGKLVALLVISWLMSESYYAFAFFALGMLPSVMAIAFDRGAGRFASKTLAAMNFTGILPFLVDIAQSPEKSYAAQQHMVDFWVWLFIYGTAAMGWVMIWIIPQIVMIIFSLRVDFRVKAFKLRQQELIKEWGEDVTKGEMIIKLPSRSGRSE